MRLQSLKTKTSNSRLDIFMLKMGMFRLLFIWQTAISMASALHVLSLLYDSHPGL